MFGFFTPRSTKGGATVIKPRWSHEKGGGPVAGEGVTKTDTEWRKDAASHLCLGLFHSLDLQWGQTVNGY